MKPSPYQKSQLREVIKEHQLGKSTKEETRVKIEAIKENREEKWPK